MFDVDPNLVQAVIVCESAGDPKAVSAAGAQGLMQIMPATWDEWVKLLKMSIANPFSPHDNIKVGSNYLGYLIKGASGNLELALASYNAGPGRVRKACREAGSFDWEKVKEFLPEETQKYVPKVMAEYRKRMAEISEV